LNRWPDLSLLLALNLRRLDNRFHETGIDGTGSMLVDSSFELNEEWCHGKMASGGRVGD
jgi:hypothetical protein